MNHVFPKFARVLAFASVHMLTPAWGQTHDASMGGTALAMTEITKGELKRGAKPHLRRHRILVPQIGAMGHRRDPDRDFMLARRLARVSVRVALPRC
jgi:hypothetical protein